eukprot:2783138-Pyramimonas_sp.AAC.1
MQRAGLSISPKSAAARTKLDDAKAIVRRVRAHGFVVKAAPQAPYLGADLGGGSRHARASRTARQAKHKAMHKR